MKLWHRYKFIRDLYSAVYRLRLRRVARFIVKRKLFWNIADDTRWRNLL